MLGSDGSLECLTIPRAFGFSTPADDNGPPFSVLADLNNGREFTTSALRKVVLQQYQLIKKVCEILQLPSTFGIRVAVVLPNSSEYVSTFLSLAYGGGVNCLLNPQFTYDEFRFAFEDMRCELLIVGQSGNSAAEKVAQDLKIPSLRLYLETSDEGEVTPVFQEGNSVFRWTSEDHATAQEEPSRVTGSTICLKLHTSGTTSKPKIVPISHAMVVTSMWNICKTYQWIPGVDCGLLVMPLFHVHGLFCGCLAPLVKKSKVVIATGQSFHKSSFWADVKTQKVTWVTAVPSIWQILVQDTDQGNRTPLRFVRGCSSSMPPALLENVEELFGTQVLEAYAMTEATHQMTSNVLGNRVIGSVGVVQGLDVAIVDPESKHVAEKGQCGEVCVRGYNLLKAYEGLDERGNLSHFLRQEELVFPKENVAFLSRALDLSSGASVFEDVMAEYMNDAVPFPVRTDWRTSPIRDRPFLKTGDVGVMDDDGSIRLIGRSKELINRGGEKISPLEVDAAFLEIEGVLEASSFAGHDAVLGEVVHICLVTSCQTDLAAFVVQVRQKVSRKLAKFKVPSKIFIVSALPKGPTGKVLRRNLADYVDHHNLVPY